MGSSNSQRASEEGNREYLPETKEQRIREAERDAEIERTELRRQICELEKKREDLEFEMLRVDKRLAFRLADITQEHDVLETHPYIPGSTLLDEPHLMTIKGRSLPSEEQGVHVIIPETTSMDEEQLLMSCYASSKSSLPLEEQVAFFNSIQVDVPGTTSMDVPQTWFSAKENLPKSEEQMSFVNTQVLLSASDLQTSISVEERQPQSEEAVEPTDSQVQIPDTVSAYEPHTSMTAKEILAQSLETTAVTPPEVHIPVPMSASAQAAMTSKEFPPASEPQTSMAVTDRQLQSEEAVELTNAEDQVTDTVSACEPHTSVTVKGILSQLEETMVVSNPEVHIPVTASASEQAAMTSKELPAESEILTSMDVTAFTDAEVQVTDTVSACEPHTSVTVKEILSQLEETMVVTNPEVHIPVTASASEQAALISKELPAESEILTSMDVTELTDVVVQITDTVSACEQQTSMNVKEILAQLEESMVVTHPEFHIPVTILSASDQAAMTSKDRLAVSEPQTSMTATERQQGPVPLLNNSVVSEVMTESKPQTAMTSNGRLAQLQELVTLVDTQVHRPGTVLACESQISMTATEILSNPQVQVLDTLPVPTGDSSIQSARESQTASTKKINYNQRKRPVQIDNVNVGYIADPRVSLDSAGSTGMAKQPWTSASDYTLTERQAQCEESVQLGNSGISGLNMLSKQSPAFKTEETVPRNKHRKKKHRKKALDKTKVTKLTKAPVILKSHTLTECKSDKTIQCPYTANNVEPQALINLQIPAITYQQYIKELRDSDQRILDYQYFHYGLKCPKKKKKKN